MDCWRSFIIWGQGRTRSSCRWRRRRRGRRVAKFASRDRLFFPIRTVKVCNMATGECASPFHEADPAPEEHGATTPAFNAANRRIAASCWSEAPSATLVATQVVMEPLRQLMQRHLGLSGDGWSTQQRTRLLLHLWRADLQLASRGRRSRRAFNLRRSAYVKRSSCCAKNSFGAACLSGLWQCGTVVCGFRLVIRMACCVDQLLACSHRRYPTKLCRLLLGDDNVL